MHKNILAKIMLFTVAILYGASYAVMQVGGEHIGPFLFSSLREGIAAITLLIMIIVSKIWTKKKSGNQTSEKLSFSQSVAKWKQENKTLLKAAVPMSCILIVATVLLQIGVMYTQTFKVAFINTLYIFFVPTFSFFFGKKVSMKTWICVGVAVIGLYFLCIKESFFIEFGDIIVLMAACLWAIQFLIIERYAPEVSALELMCIQFSIATIPTFLLSLMFDHYFMAEIAEVSLMKALPSLLYTGIFASAVACSLQTAAQRVEAATTASLILSTENMFAIFIGMLVLHEVISGREIVGCILMTIAIVAVQLPEISRNKAAKFAKANLS